MPGQIDQQGSEVLEQAQGPAERRQLAAGTGLSLIVPVFNEEGALEPFFARVEPVLEQIAETHGFRFEVIFIDDGSRDGTLSYLLSQRESRPYMKVVALTRNFGKDIALTAGLDYAGGAAVIPIDCDMQDPPELIPQLVDKWLEGYDAVYARRVARESDTRAKRFTATLFYRIYNSLADLDIPSDTGDFRLLDRRVVEALRRLPERNRFMKGLYPWVGYKQTGVDYVREPRAAGDSKWSYWRLWNFALDGITSSTTLPLRIWSYLGLVIALLSFVYAILLIADTLITGVDVPGYASLMVVILFIGGMLLMTLGIIGEYLGRIYMEVKGRPNYLVRETHGAEPKETEVP